MLNLRAGFAITASFTRIDGLIYIGTTRWMSSPDPTRRVHCGGGDCLFHRSSIPDAEVRGILAAELGKAKTQMKTCKSTTRKYSIAKQLATYLSLVVWEELLRFLATDRVLLRRSVWISALRVGLCSSSLLSPDATSSAQPSLDISTIYMKPHMSILKIWLTDRGNWKNKRVNKCLLVKDYF